MKYFFTLIILTLFTVSGYSQQFKVIPKAGLNISTVTSDVPDIDPDGPGTGYHAGAELRLGDYDSWFFLQPGLFYYSSSVDINAVGFNNQRVSDNVKVNSLKLPLNLGFFVTGTDGLLRFSINGGIVPAVVLGVGDSNIDPDNTNFRTFGMGANVGVGMDIALFTFNLGYEYGVSKVFKSGEGRQNMITMSVGIVIPPTF